MSCDLKVTNASSGKGKSHISYCGRFPFRQKTPEISVGAKVEFPIGKKLFHLVVTPVRRGARR